MEIRDYATKIGNLMTYSAWLAELYATTGVYHLTHEDDQVASVLSFHALKAMNMMFSESEDKFTRRIAIRESIAYITCLREFVDSGLLIASDKWSTAAVEFMADPGVAGYCCYLETLLESDNHVAFLVDLKLGCVSDITRRILETDLCKVLTLCYGRRYWDLEDQQAIVRAWKKPW